jgi:hypothetical protein
MAASVPTNRQAAQFIHFATLLKSKTADAIKKEPAASTI